MTFDASALRGDLFHLCGTLLAPGSIILPGNWGRVVHSFGWAHGSAMREHALEQARQALAPHLPSRLASVFTFPTEAEARAFRGDVIPGQQTRGFEAHAIYRVRLIDPVASWFLTNHMLVSPPIRQGHLNPDWPRMYWSPLENTADKQERILVGLREGRRELLTLSALEVVERLDRT